MYLYNSPVGNNMNSCKLPATSSTNVYKTTNSNYPFMIEWLDENDNITDESMYEDDDVLNVSITIYYIIH